jgi:peptidoglycan/LPS O-acetylase OafA/YrhL
MWFAFGSTVSIPHLLDYSLLSVKVFFVLSGHLVAYQYLQDGRSESLFSAIFRRVPRLFIPAFCANLLYWVLSALGAYASESTWRKMIPNSTFCEGCIPSDLSVVVASSIRVLWSFGRDHFVWLWTVSQEIYGSVIVFMLAPAFRWIVDSDIWGFDDNTRIGSLVLPRRLHRCIVAYATFFLSAAVLHVVIAAWITSVINTERFSNQLLQAESVALTFYLFTAGLAIAHVGIVFGEVEHRIYWASVPMQTLKKSLYWIPISLIVTGLATPWMAAYAERFWYWTSGYWMPMLSYLLTFGAIGLLAGVASSPQEVCTAMSRFSPVGQISYSLYLLHMSVVYAVGMPFYVWIQPILNSAALTFAAVVILTTGPMAIFSYFFWRYVEDPLGVRLPVYAFNALWRQRGPMTSLISGKFALLTTPVKLLYA